MNRTALSLLFVLLSACSAPHFVGDAPPVPVTSQTPDHFELPARFGLARLVYGRPQAAGAKEEALWQDTAKRLESLGSFTQLITGQDNGWHINEKDLISAARQQRYNYLLVVRMHPDTGSADVALLDVGSGGVMATAQAVAPGGGQNGFWGGEINNPARLERATLRLAKSAIPIVENLLLGAAERQR